MVLTKSRPDLDYKRMKSVKIDHLMYMDDLKLFCKDRNGMPSLAYTVCKSVSLSDDNGRTFGVTF